jgi:hypothetical protein
VRISENIEEEDRKKSLGGVGNGSKSSEDEEEDCREKFRDFVRLELARKGGEEKVQ